MGFEVVGRERGWEVRCEVSDGGKQQRAAYLLTFELQDGWIVARRERLVGRYNPTSGGRNGS